MGEDWRAGVAIYVVCGGVSYTMHVEEGGRGIARSELVRPVFRYRSGIVRRLPVELGFGLFVRLLSRDICMEILH